MFLKNVPPVVALHTEWRSYGPTRNFSLPLCFNDSDSDISTTGTPIPEKVQMIIDSLRNTESSIDMSDEYEGALQSGQGPSPGCAGVVHKSRRRGPLGVAREDKHLDSMDFGTQSQDSDSDDSVDRGIEEAIQEYLKNKDDHKRELEPTASPSQVPKQLKRERPFSDTPKNLDGNIILTASSNYIQRNVKKARSERPAEERPLLGRKGDITKAVKTFPSFETKECLTNVCSHSNEGHSVGAVKLEVESPDSSSDDGIEEAIRHYQLEKMKENTEDLEKPCKFSQPNEESDSSSDGIEEAIRCYQLEKQKEEVKHVSKAVKISHPKEGHGSKASPLCLDHSGTQPIKKQKVFTKKRKTERNSKPALSTPAASRFTLSNSLSNPDMTDDGVPLAKSKVLSEKRTPAPLKVNTTAELMCAEAILDISKAVMPVMPVITAFPNNCVSSFHGQDRTNCVENKTDESSIDSDDGIEQEIRKFLEIKAQMRSQPSGTSNFPGTGMDDQHAMSPQEKRKADPSQNKKLRLSLSHKRKCKEEGNICVAEVLDSKLPDEHQPQPLAAHDNDTLRTHAQASASQTAAVALIGATTEKTEEPTKNGKQQHATVSLKDFKDFGTEGDSYQSSSKNEVSKSLSLAERKAQTGDKSSSFDSDEDLDAAIKDLLLTKKKVKRRQRDRKLKSKKSVHFGAVQVCPVDETESEKKKTLTDCKTSPTSKNSKSCISKSGKDAPKQNTNGGSVKPKLCKNSTEQPKASKQVKDSSLFVQIGQKKAHTGVELLSDGSRLAAAHIEQDSSSVDSDDSIEQEIRKFLAEKAKLSVVRTKDGENAKNISDNPTDSMTTVGVKMEPQQAEIPYGVLPCSGVSGRPGCWETEVLKSASLGFDGHVPQSADKGLSPLLASTSSSPSSLKSDEEVKTVKAVKTDRLSLKNSSSDKTDPDVEKRISVSKINPVSPGYKAGNIYTHQATLPLMQTGSVSHSSFHISPPMRVRDVRVTHTSDQDGLACETPDAVCPAARNHENVNQVESLEPSPQSPNTSTAAIPNSAAPTPARQPDEDVVLEETRGNGLEQNATPCPPGNVAHIKMNKPPFLELSSRRSNYVEIKSRDVSKVCTREREEGKGEVGDLREGSEECIDETGDESEESPGASQRWRAKKQFPRLILSTSIDPGESFRPYIILNTPERKLRHPGRRVFFKDQQSDNLKTHADTHKLTSHQGPERILPNYAVNVNTFYSRISPSTVRLTKRATRKRLVKRKLHFHKRQEEKKQMQHQ